MDPATASAIARLAKRLSGEKRLVLAAHVDSDGDAIGSLCGLARALSLAGRQVYAALPDDGPAPSTYRRVPGFEHLAPASGAPSWPLLVALDVPVFSRLGAVEAAARAAPLRIRVDHHPEGETFGEFDVADETAPATAALVWRLLEAMEVPTDAATAEALYVGLVTDTGRFQYSNATVDAHIIASEMIEAGVRPEEVFRYIYDTKRMAALKLQALIIQRARLELDGRLVWAEITDDDLQTLGARPEETENLIDELRSIEGVEVALMIKGRSDGLKGSLRSRGAADVARIAKALGGGGHREAAGFPFHGTAEQAAAAVLELVGEQLDKDA